MNVAGKIAAGVFGQRLLSDTVAAIAAATIQPTGEHISRVNRAFGLLALNPTLRTKLDAIWYMPFGGINILAPATYVPVAHGTGRFVAGGYKSDGSTGYLDTGYKPSGNGVQFTTAASHLAVYPISDGSTGVQFDVGGQTTSGGNGRCYLNSHASTNAITAALSINTSTATTGTNGSVFDAVGLTIVSRESNVTTLYKNGVSIGTLSQSSSSPCTVNLFIGARNNQGTADSFSSRIIGLVSVGASLTAAEAILWTQICDMLCRPLIQATVFVNASTGNDATGDGSLAFPLASLDGGYQFSTAGQTIQFAGSNPASPVDYRAATRLTVTKAVTFKAEVAGGAKLTSTSTGGAVIVCSPTNGETITFDGVIVDGRDLCTIGIQPTDVATTMNVNVRNATVKGCSLYQIGMTGAANRINLNVAGSTVQGPATGTGCRAGIYINALSAGSVSVTDSTITIPAMILGGYGGVTVFGLAELPVSVLRNTVTVTIDAAGNASTYSGILTRNVKGAVITGNTVSMLGQVSGYSGIGVLVSAVIAAPIDSSGYIVTINTVTSDCLGGNLIRIGEEGPTGADTYVGTGTVASNDCSATATARAADTDGITIGSGASPLTYRNKVHSVYNPLVAKEDNGSQFYDNILYDFDGAAMRAKGSVNSKWWHNTIHSTVATSRAWYITENDANGHVSSGVDMTGGNNIVLDGVSGGIVGYIDATSTATFGYSNYYLLNGATLDAAAFNYQGTTYGTIAAWIAAREATAINVNPQFVNAATHNYDVQSTAIDIVPANAAVLTDYLGRAFASPASVGAYQKQ